jgi:hypothetical protein
MTRGGLALVHELTAAHPDLALLALQAQTLVWVAEAAEPVEPEVAGVRADAGPGSEPDGEKSRAPEHSEQDEANAQLSAAREPAETEVAEPAAAAETVAARALTQVGPTQEAPAG